MIDQFQEFQEWYGDHKGRSPKPGAINLWSAQNMGFQELRISLKLQARADSGADLASCKLYFASLAKYGYRGLEFS